MTRAGLPEGGVILQERGDDALVLSRRAYRGREFCDLRFGVHLCRMSGFDPPSSETLWWDRRVVSVEQLEKLIRFELHPDSLRPWSPRRHHLPPVGDGPTGVLPFDEEAAPAA